MKTNELMNLLKELGFTLIGSRAINKAREDSDYDFAITDERIYIETIALLKNSGKVKYLKKDMYKDKYSGSICVGSIKVGVTDNLKNPISDEGDIFDLHLVDKILPKNKQILLHYKKYGL